jgi:hypothetical protein
VIYDSAELNDIEYDLHFHCLRDRIWGKFQYFVRNGFWHVQLWQPLARVSVLTPSRLTRDRYEVFPIAGWKVGAQKYTELAKLIADAHSVALLPELALLELERLFVQRVNDARSTSVVRRRSEYGPRSSNHSIEQLPHWRLHCLMTFMQRSERLADRVACSRPQ